MNSASRFFDRTDSLKCSLLALLQALVLFFTLSVFGVSQEVPAGFHWVDFKREASTVSDIEKALKNENYTALREIGLTGTFALVFVIQRESDQTTFDGDMWSVYSVSTKTWNFRTLLSGYRVNVRDWIRFEPQGPKDLGVVYEDCWECEPTAIFTVLHYESQKGWRARWSNDKDANHPGIAIDFSDVGDPYTNEDVDQVFAVLVPENGVGTGGTLYYARDLSTGKVRETAAKFWVDPATGEDKYAEMKGTAAKIWETKLCKAKESPYGLSQGQSSSVCKRVLSKKGRK